MLVSFVAVLGILGATVCGDTYIINPAPSGYNIPAQGGYHNPAQGGYNIPPAYNPQYPYVGRQNFTRPNTYNNTWNNNNYNNNACLSVGYDVPKSHSVFVGCRQAGDNLLYTETISKTGRFFSTREKIIDYPGEVPKGHVRNENITAVWCYDLRGYSKGGYCTIMQGGIGKKHVRIHMYHNIRNEALNFKLEIYGRPSNATVGYKLH